MTPFYFSMSWNTSKCESVKTATLTPIYQCNLIFHKWIIIVFIVFYSSVLHLSICPLFWDHENLKDSWYRLIDVIYPCFKAMHSVRLLSLCFCYKKQPACWNQLPAPEHYGTNPRWSCPSLCCDLCAELRDTWEASLARQLLAELVYPIYLQCEPSHLSKSWIHGTVFCRKCVSVKRGHKNRIVLEITNF